MKNVLHVYIAILGMFLLFPAMGEAKAANKKNVNYWKFKNADLASYIARNYDKNEDGKLSAGEIKKIKKIVLPDADDSKAKTMALRDLSKLPYIESLELSGGDDYGAMKKVKGLKNLYRLKKLKNVRIAACDLSGGLKTSQWKKLKELRISECRIPGLSLGKNSRLRTVIIRGNPMNTLNMKGNKKLEVLRCMESPMNTLDVSRNVNLKELVYYGQMPEGDCKWAAGSKNRLKALDLSKNKKLASLELCGMAEPSVTAIRLYGNGQNLKKLSFGHQYDREEVDLSGWNLRSLEEFECSAHRFANPGYGDNACLTRQIVLGSVPKLKKAHIDMDAWLKVIRIQSAPHLADFRYKGSPDIKVTVNA